MSLENGNNMKHLFLFVVLLMFTATATFAQEATEEVAAEEVNSGPKMEFETTTVDFGTIEKGSDPLRTVSFTNTGDAPLVIKQAKGSCGCTVPNWKKTPVMPGEASTMEIRYDTKRVGPIRKTVRVTTNEGGQPHVLQVRGTVKAEGEIENLPEKVNPLTGEKE